MFRRWCRSRCAAAAHDRRAGPRLSDGKSHRREHEEGEENRRQLMQERRRAARAERRLRSAAAERSRQIRPFSLLHEDHKDEEDADEYMKNYENNR